jgi:ubiquinone/menaquinone biosynthesis C-methylase UbiE
MLAGRLVADYGITKGRCLLILGGDGSLQQTLQRDLAKWTELEIVALYPTEKLVDQAEARIRREGLDGRIVCKVGILDALPFDDASVDLLAGVGPVLIWGDRQKKLAEIYRVLRDGGAALVGGRYRGMPESRKVSSDTLRAAAKGIPSIRIVDDMGQWVEVLKGAAGR